MVNQKWDFHQKKDRFSGKFFKKVLIIDSEYVTIRYSLGIFSTIHLYSIGFGSEFLIQEKGSKRQ